MLSTATVYRTISSNLDRSLSTISNKPEVQREIAYYKSKIGSIKSIDDFMGDTRLYNFVMKAFGLGDMAYAKAFVRKVLEGGIDDSDSLANKLTDLRYRDLVTTFNFARYGDATTVFDRAQQGVIDKSIRQNLEETTGKDSEGARMALYFSRKAPSLTSVYGILADKALLQVTLTKLQLPDSFSLLSLDKQAEILSSKINLADFKDSTKLDKFVNTFTILWDIKNPPAQTTTPITNILPSYGSAGTIGLDLLSSLQRLRLGGS